MRRWLPPNCAISHRPCSMMLTVELLHAAVESAVIASVRAFRLYIEADAVVDQDPCVSAAGLSPFRRSSQIISESRKKALAIVLVSIYLPRKTV